MQEMKDRILPLDGWRTIASLGVVWIHAWIFCGNPALTIFGFNVFKPLAIVGNGVDFFFVISGFCLYLILKNKPINTETYFTFLKNRWLRIAPAFYICAVVVLIGTIKLYTKGNVFTIENLRLLFLNFTYLNNFIPSPGKTNSNISAPFWSLAVEFQFYIILPFVLLISSKVGIKKTLYGLFVFGLCMNFIFTSEENNYHLVTKICHFTLGILCAVFFLENKPKPNILTQYWGLILGILIMFLGRYIMADIFVSNNSFIISKLSKTFGSVILTSGFALVMLNSITSNKTGKWLSNPILQFYGKISYSVYLWHYALLMLATRYVMKIPVSNACLAIILFFAGLLIITPIAYASYYFVERLYLKRKK